MKIEDFEDFCVQVIDKYIADIEELQEKENCKCIKVKAYAKRKIFKYYQRKRDEIKNNYMEKPAKSLDRHKVAACMMYAVLRSKVLKVNRFIPHIPTKLLMANEDLERDITIDELKDLLSKYEQLDSLVEKLTAETHIVY